MINEQQEPVINQPKEQKEKHQEEWMRLCEQAAVEQDPDKLVVLTREICRLLDERERALKGRRSS